MKLNGLSFSKINSVKTFGETYINPALKQFVTTFLYGSNIEPFTEFLEQMAI